MRQTIITALETAADSANESLAFSELNRSGEKNDILTFGQLAQMTNEYRDKILQSFPAGSRVLLIYPHKMEYIKAFYGCLSAGIIPVTVSTSSNLGWSSIENIARACGASAIFTMKIFEAKIHKSRLGQYCESLPIISTDDWREDHLNIKTVKDIPNPNLAYIQYTSGSTNAPKGVMISHENIIANVRALKKTTATRINRLDTIVSWLPFCHDLGLVCHVLFPVYMVNHSVFTSPINVVTNPLNWLAIISKYRGVFSGAPNFIFELCNRRIGEDDVSQLDLECWKVAYCGSERIHAETIRTFTNKFKPAKFKPDQFYAAYGMAEATLLVSACQNLKITKYNEDSPEYVCVGDSDNIRADIKIVDIASRTTLPENSVGEIWIKSKSVSDGYYEDDQGTSVTFNQSLSGNSGYLRSGDLGFFRNGELYYVGRTKGLIKVNGKPHSLEDIEGTIAQKVSKYMFDYCVAFQNVTDEKDNTLVVMLSVGRATQRYDASYIQKLISSYLEGHIGVKLRSVVFVKSSAVPITTSGKVKRTMCLKLFEAENFDEIDSKPIEFS